MPTKWENLSEPLDWDNLKLWSGHDVAQNRNILDDHGSWWGQEKSDFILAKDSLSTSWLGLYREWQEGGDVWYP